MHTTPAQTCRGYQCTMQKTLPFAGPLAAFLGMVIVMATLAPAMVG